MKMSDFQDRKLRQNQAWKIVHSQQLWTLFHSDGYGWIFKLEN
jgi:hypothetical protein